MGRIAGVGDAWRAGLAVWADTDAGWADQRRAVRAAESGATGDPGRSKAADQAAQSGNDCPRPGNHIHLYRRQCGNAVRRASGKPHSPTSLCFRTGWERHAGNRERDAGGGEGTHL